MNFNCCCSLVQFPEVSSFGVEVRSAIASDCFEKSGQNFLKSDYCHENLRAVSSVPLPFSVCWEGEKSLCLIIKTIGPDAVTPRYQA